MAEHDKTVYNANGVEFTIYKSIKATKAGPKPYWLLADRSTGKRRLLNNKTLKAAKRRADQIRAAMVKGQAHRALLSNGQWQDVCAALEIHKSVQSGQSLRTAIASWAECMAMLGDRATLLDAIKFYLANHKGSGPHKPIQFVEAAKLYHQAKVQEGKSGQHCKNIFARLVNQLPAELPPAVVIDELTGGQLDQAVIKLGLKAKTRNEYRIVLSSLYKWAGKQNPPLVPKDFNPAKDMERYAVKHGDVNFLRVADLRKILACLPAKRPDLLPMVTLVSFAGLRPSEAARLDWRDVGQDYIRLPGNKSKTGYSRQIPIQPNLKSWLAQWRKDSGLLCPDVSLEHINAAVLRVSGVA